MTRWEEADEHVDELLASLKELGEWDAKKWFNDEVNELTAKLGRVPPEQVISDAAPILNDVISHVLRPYRDSIITLLTPLTDGYVAPGSIERVARVGIPNIHLAERITSPLSAGMFQSQIKSFEPDMRSACRVVLDAASQAAAEHQLLAKNDVLGQMDKAHNIGLAEVKSLRDEATKTRADIQQLLNEAVTIAETRAFAKASVKFAHQSDGWLGATVATAFMLMCLLLMFMFQNSGLPPELRDKSVFVAGSVAHFGPRVALVALLSTLLAVCVKTFRAARHNEVINEHRANSLGSVQLLAKHGETTVQQHLLELAAASVFVPASSAFDGKEVDAAVTVNELLRTLRSTSTAASTVAKAIDTKPGS